MGFTPNPIGQLTALPTPHNWWGGLCPDPSRIAYSTPPDLIAGGEGFVRTP